MLFSLLSKRLKASSSLILTMSCSISSRLSLELSDNKNDNEQYIALGISQSSEESVDYNENKT